MLANRRPGEVPLTPEDRARLTRLYEEVAGRLDEAARIMSRTLGWDANDKVFAWELPHQLPPSIRGLGSPDTAPASSPGVTAVASKDTGIMLVSNIHTGALGAHDAGSGT